MRIPRFKKDIEDFHHYKIGELSEILRIPAPTIRSYDKLNLVNPNKRDESQYRKYTVIDGNYFIRIKEYRNLGLSQMESIKMLTDSELDEFTEKHLHIQKKLEEELFWIAKRKEGLQRKYNKFRNLRNSLNQISIVERPSMWRCNHQRFDRFEEEAVYKEDRVKWTSAMPASFFSLKFPEGDMLEYQFKESVYWGLAIEEDLVGGTGLDTLSGSEYIPAQKCLYTVVCASNEVCAKPRYFDFVMEYLAQNELQLAGDVYGSFICNVKDGRDGYQSYYDAYFPIE